MNLGFASGLADLPNHRLQPTARGVIMVARRG